LFFALSLVTPFIIFVLFGRHKQFLVMINAGLICFYYIVLLFLVKLNYKKINNAFIKKGLIEEEYNNKDYTYVFWDGDIPTVGSWWNEKLASKPSWLDHVITYTSFLIPIIIFWFLNTFILS